ncbi:MAG TPA: HAD family hydrolase [Dermatophilaceae bacterium]|nr:HAD family hydrolase [Dermatophilaceae bacterium]
MRAPRLVATDLDGTLLRSDGTVSERTARLLADVEQAGVHVVFVTARPPRWLDALAGIVAGHGTAICGNGAFVYAVASREVVTVHGFEHGEVQDVIRDLRASVPGTAFAAERASGLWSEPGFPHGPGHPLPDDHVERPIEQLSGELVGKLLARSRVLAEGEFLAAVADVVGERGQVAYSGAGGLAEISAPGVTKAATLERWAAALGIGAEDVWAVGDMPNDLPLLEWAGVGWAVGNAHPDVLAAASRRCAANDDDGVADVLERVLEMV